METFNLGKNRADRCETSFEDNNEVSLDILDIIGPVREPSTSFFNLEVLEATTYR